LTEELLLFKELIKSALQGRDGALQEAAAMLLEPQYPQAPSNASLSSAASYALSGAAAAGHGGGALAGPAAAAGGASATATAAGAGGVAAAGAAAAAEVSLAGAGPMTMNPGSQRVLEGPSSCTATWNNPGSSGAATATATATAGSGLLQLQPQPLPQQECDIKGSVAWAITQMLSSPGVAELYKERMSSGGSAAATLTQWQTATRAGSLGLLGTAGFADLSAVLGGSLGSSCAANGLLKLASAQSLQNLHSIMGTVSVLGGSGRAASAAVATVREEVPGEESEQQRQQQQQAWHPMRQQQQQQQQQQWQFGRSPQQLGGRAPSLPLTPAAYLPLVQQNNQAEQQGNPASPRLHSPQLPSPYPHHHHQQQQVQNREQHTVCMALGDLSITAEGSNAHSSGSAGGIGGGRGLPTMPQTGLGASTAATAFRAAATAEPAAAPALVAPSASDTATSAGDAAGESGAATAAAATSGLWTPIAAAAADTLQAVHGSGDNGVTPSCRTTETQQQQQQAAVGCVGTSSSTGRWAPIGTISNKYAASEVLEQSALSSSSRRSSRAGRMPYLVTLERSLDRSRRHHSGSSGGAAAAKAAAAAGKPAKRPFLKRRLFKGMSKLLMLRCGRVDIHPGSLGGAVPPSLAGAVLPGHMYRTASGQRLRSSLGRGEGVLRVSGSGVVVRSGSGLRQSSSLKPMPPSNPAGKSGSGKVSLQYF
jgi:hypothetical protein